LRSSIFAKPLDDELQAYLTASSIEWRVLDRTAQQLAEAEWRQIFGQAFIGRARMRIGAKALSEYLDQPCTRFLIVPFSQDVIGTPMHVRSQRIAAYECTGKLVPLGQFCDVEFSISPGAYEWTMVHTHEDYAIDGPYFIRREWLGW